MKRHLAIAAAPEPKEVEAGGDAVRLTGEAAKQAEQANLRALEAAIEASGWLRR
jgi:hypothetical protein